MNLFHVKLYCELVFLNFALFKEEIMDSELKNSLSSSKLFIATAPIVAVLAVIALIWPVQLTNAIVSATAFFYKTYDWFIIWIPLAALTLCLIIAFSKYGNIRLGGANAVPEYSFYSWMAMLFTAGIGVGIVFYGPIEALWHYFQSPIGIAAGYDPGDAAENAMSLALWVWGLPAWSLYALGGLIVAYFAYQKNGDFTPAASFEIGFHKKSWAKPLAALAAGVAVVSIALSVSSSIAMATTQVTAGLKIISGIDLQGNLIKIIILAIIFVIYTGAAVLPIQKGMKFLGDWTMYIAIALMIYVFLVGPTQYFMSVMVNTIGKIITETIPYGFELYLFRKRDWLIWYPLSYWVWWITWMPFVGAFLAKISKGRTIKEFLLAAILAPTGFMIVWFSIFSGFALVDTIEGTGVVAEIGNSGGYEGTIYYLLNLLPFSGITKIVVALLFLSFVITTVTSAAISLGIMTSHDGKSESKIKTIIWSVFMALVAFAVVVTGSIEGIKAVGSFAGFPFVFLIFLMSSALIRQMRKDHGKPNLED